MEEEEREIERQERIKSILRDFRIGKEKKVFEGLAELQEIGDSQVILPLIDLWNKGVSTELEEKIMEFLGDLKATDAIEPIMDALLDESFLKIRQPLLNTIWNCKVDFSEYLMDFVTLSINHDFMTTLECLTIIDSLEGPFEEQTLLDAQIVLREYAEGQQNKKSDADEKVKLVSQIADSLKQHENNTIY